MKRIPEPQKNGHQFVYQKYGRGQLLHYMNEASNETQKISSALLQYRIVSGTLSDQKLLEQFRSLGYDPDVKHKQSYFSMMISFLLSNSIALSLIIFLLTFTALTVISRIKDLHSAGIRLISSESIWTIMFQSVKSDLATISFSFVFFSIVGLLIFSALGFRQMGLWRLLTTALLFYSLLLVLGSVFLSFIYILGLRPNNLMSTIKGKLPVGKLIAVILFCQLLAVIAVGWGFGRIPQYYQQLKEEQRSANQWAKASDRIDIGLGADQAYDNPNEFGARFAKWYGFLDEAITEQNALMVKNNFLAQRSENMGLGTTNNNYDPKGNTIYVTPNYFDLQKIRLDSKVKQQITNLQPGQLGLILPEKLKPEVKKYQRMFKDSLDFAKNSSIITGYVPNNQERFVYNNISVSSKQFVKDPIIVVVTPKATGKSFDSMMFWTNNVDHYMFYSGYDKTSALLKKHHLFGSVSDLTSSQQGYNEQIQFFRNQIISLFISSMLGVVTAILLFNSMNLLYFEEFRKDILIKRIAGMRFIELHWNYLAIQFGILLLGFAVNRFLTQNFSMSLLTLLLFGGSSLVTLYFQMRKENKFAVTVLKGM